MMDLNQDIQDAIAKNLPGLAADELKKFIANAQEVEKKLARVQDDLKTANTRLAEKEEKLAAHRELAERERIVEESEAKSRQKELAVEMREAKLVAAEALAELKGVKDTTNLFLRNTVVHNNLTGSVPVAYPHTPAGVGYSGQGNPAGVMTHPTSALTSTTEGLAPDPSDPPGTNNGITTSR